MRFGIVILPEQRWSTASRRWRHAEELGFDHAWTYDHLAWRSLADGPWFGTVPTLTAAALATSRIRLGTMVTSPNFRHPVAYARELLSLDDISNGRFTLGVGAGGGGFDATILGHDPLPPAQRAARFAEFVELLDRLLTEDHVTYQGEYYRAADARTLPGCVQQPRPPFVIAANGPKTMRLVARFGTGWVTVGPSERDDTEKWWRGVAQLSARLDDVLVAHGRDPSELERYLGLDSAGPALASVEHFAEAAGRAAGLGFTDVYVHWPRPEGVHAADERVLEKVAADIIPALR
ncbi:luciferase [Longimycelium tulufanense]|uniref:Luciferase n=1 Tax=Longimycelium tulufanense TaxID=907463 RepID=A0A8J3CCZ7_9PSEU|nr:LLM class flavin-dependent oxidoreductase [Longimycelium tulufanense]GGM47965.1 luciferase [Longimycelium tulufanense]